MRLLVGDTRSRKLLEEIARRGTDRSLLTGQLVQRGRLGPWLRERQAGRRGWLWAYDNAAFEDWRQGRPFDAGAFAEDLARIAELPRHHKPTWIVLPDVVCGGARSLDLSLSWLDRLPHGWGVPAYLALQEGIDPAAVPAWAQTKIDGWFIGGASWRWKVSAAAAAVAWARDEQNPAAGDQFVHVGRVGSAAKILACRRIGVQSVDSNSPLWSAEAWRRAVDALRAPLHPRLPGFEGGPTQRFTR